MGAVPPRVSSRIPKLPIKLSRWHVSALSGLNLFPPQYRLQFTSFFFTSRVFYIFGLSPATFHLLGWNEQSFAISLSTERTLLGTKRAKLTRTFKPEEHKYKCRLSAGVESSRDLNATFPLVVTLCHNLCPCLLARRNDCETPFFNLVLFSFLFQKKKLRFAVSKTLVFRTVRLILAWNIKLT